MTTRDERAAPVPSFRRPTPPAVRRLLALMAALGRRRGIPLRIVVADVEAMRRMPRPAVRGRTADAPGPGGVR